MKLEHTDTALRMLLVEDSEHDVLAFRRTFHKSQVAVQITICRRAEEALEQLHAEPAAFDLVISDYSLPGISGLELCRELLARELGVPLVILTGAGTERLAVEALKCGVDDYLIKDASGGYLELLPVLLPAVVQQRRDRLARQRAEAQLAASEARQRLVLTQMPALVWTLDLDLRFTSSGGAGLAGINSRPNQSVGMSLYEYCQTDDPEFRPIAAARQALRGEAVSYEIEWSGRAFQSHVEPFRDPQGYISGVIGIALDITERKAAEAERERLIGELQAALAKIKTLRGLLPICASCKNIRDDQGYWTQVEVYVRKHSEAEFSHSICPDCAVKLYPELFEEEQGS
jgi:PAS domain-containing protein